MAGIRTLTALVRLAMLSRSGRPTLSLGSWTAQSVHGSVYDTPPDFGKPATVADPIHPRPRRDPFCSQMYRCARGGLRQKGVDQSGLSNPGLCGYEHRLEAAAHRLGKPAMEAG
jgi:hypothetical protein